MFHKRRREFELLGVLYLINRTLRFCRDIRLRYGRAPLYVFTGPDASTRWHGIHATRMQGDPILFECILPIPNLASIHPSNRNA
jgi:hypothetical protein